MQNLAQSTADRLVARGIIQEKDVPVYCYGLEAIYSSTLELVSILLLAALVGNFWQTVAFFLAFIPLRVYAGGYHATTRLRCFLISLAVYGLFAVALALIPAAWYRMLALAGCAWAGWVVWRRAPVVHHNRRISLAARQHYRKTSRLICAIEVMLILVGVVILPENAIVFALLLGLMAEALSMVAVGSAN